MKTYDISIVGAGPCGIACAIKSAEKGKKVILVECGRDYDNRYCSVDDNKECNNCIPCNVIAGFGGCVHYGDSIKLSSKPSGKKLYYRLQEEYDRLRKEACLFWNVGENEFISNSINTEAYGFDVKSYPVCIMGSNKVKERIRYFKKRIKELKIDYCNDTMLDFNKECDKFLITLKSGKTIVANKLVLAMGRFGLNWLKSNLDSKGIEYTKPIPSYGFRFEMPLKYLSKLGTIHPDFKAKMTINGVKYKTFCYCGGEKGGRLKFWKYKNCALLDGHILTKDDYENGYANFALLRQITSKETTEDNNQDPINDLLMTFHELSQGKPIVQRYISFKNQKEKMDVSEISTKYVKSGEVYKLIKKDLKDYCCAAERIFSFLANINNIDLKSLVLDINVIGLELEGLWDAIKMDNNFMTNLEGLYIGGDCGGETQGILQATISGIRIAEII